MMPTRRQLIARGMAGAGTLLAAGHAAEADEARTDEVPFRLGTITYNVAKDWDLPTLLHTARAAKLSGVELRTSHAHGVEPTIDPARRSEVKAMFADSGLTLWGLGTVCEFQSTDPAKVKDNVEQVRRWCALGQDLGAHGVKVRPNGLPEGANLDTTLLQIGDALRLCGDAAAQHGVEIWLEVHGKETQNPPNAQAILKHCSHPKVGACWNSNGTDVTNGSVAASFALLQPYIRSCHINDLWSSYPYRELFSLFRRSGYTGFTLCEVNQSFPPQPGLTFLQCYRALWSQLASVRR
jgi:sugar phosphate isomerase/epimerase